MNMIIDIRLIKFIFVGLTNTLIGSIIMFGLYNLYGCSYWLSSVSNYFFASILSYVLNKRFTFRYSGEVVKSGLRFALNIGTCYIIAYTVAKPVTLWLLSGYSVWAQENIAMLAGMCIFTVLNYFGQKHFVFKGEETVDYKHEYNKWVKSSLISEEERKLLLQMDEAKIRDAFYKKAEFGTAGMRGIMGPGTNRINIHTIRLAAKGLSDMLSEGTAVAIAYDTRINSKKYAYEAAGVLALDGKNVYIFDDFSPVPLLSFAVRELKCDAGIVITASHNTSEYNGFKVYDNTGCQMSEAMSERIAANMEGISNIFKIRSAANTDKRISVIDNSVLKDFVDGILSIKIDTGRKPKENLKIVYTPLHGSGKKYVTDVLQRDGFCSVETVKEQDDFDGRFPTVKKPNPEDKRALLMAAEQAIKTEADIIIGTDPDCDRIGTGVIRNGEVEYFTGNQIGAMLIDFMAQMQFSKGKSIITTIVTGEMGSIIAEDYGINVIKTLTGFKYIGNIMNGMDEDAFLMGYEESYGYLIGFHARDKDGISAALMICRMASYYKNKGMTLSNVLKELYKKYGYWIDEQESFIFEGEIGEKKIKRIMETLRNEKCCNLFGGMAVNQTLDYKIGIDNLPRANVLKFVFNDRSWLAVRPSGTEPKIKFYYCINGRDRQCANDTLKTLKECVKTVIKVD